MSDLSLPRRRLFALGARLVLALTATACVAADAADAVFVEDARVARAFEQAGLHGCFVLFNAQTGVYLGHNAERAATRFLPASTFKIPSSVIGLATGAISSVDEVLPWGGGKAFLPSWEKDMGLREAIIVSNVPIYQELARRVGLERMQAMVRLFDYGNREIGDVVDQFWLRGPLQISAIEQTRFLTRLARRELPVTRSAQDAVVEITRQAEGSDALGRDWALHAKTGMSLPDDGQGIGWWVGWVERDGQVFAFALNIDVQDWTQGPQRTELGKRILQALDLLPAVLNQSS
ncbi:MAG: class D beta-lactamase [Lysobacteraceae bacterium]